MAERQGLVSASPWPSSGTSTETGSTTWPPEPPTAAPTRRAPSTSSEAALTVSTSTRVRSSLPGMSTRNFGVSGFRCPGWSTWTATGTQIWSSELQTQDRPFTSSKILTTSYSDLPKQTFLFVSLAVSLFYSVSVQFHSQDPPSKSQTGYFR